MVEWIAGKVAGPVFLALAILFGAATAIQTVRINGISVFGWYAVDGYKPLYEQAILDNGTLRGNYAVVDAARKQCNASVDSLKTAGDLLTTNANILATAAQRANKDVAANISAMRNIKSTDETCPVADSIMQRGFQ